MPRRSPNWIAWRAALACQLAIRVASAQSAESCVEPQLNVLVPDDPKWDSATQRLADHLRSLRDLDRCARVTVRPDARGVTVQIVTGDGRRAVRHVETVDELLTASEALLVLPPTPVQSAKVSPLEVPPIEAKPAPAEPATAHVELGAGGSLRFGGGPLYVGGGVSGFAGFALDRWLFNLSARLDAIDHLVSEPGPDDLVMESAAVGVSAGRRLEIGEASLDALVGTNVVIENQDADDGDREVHGTASDFRLGLAVRISGPRSATTRAFAVTDFEASPSRARRRQSLDGVLPPLPWWSTGLTIGVMWGAR